MTLHDLVNLLLHFDAQLAHFIAAYGHWVYALLFAIVFAETGFVVTPFLPGDSMLFVVGAFAAAGQIDAVAGLGALWGGAVAGDAANFLIGTAVGHRVFGWRHSRWFNRRAFDRAHAFYLRHGGATIVAARFIPLVRTFAPFVAGVAEMPARAFFAYNVLGATLWVGVVGLAGYAFGNVPWVRANMGAMTLGVVAVSLAPIVLGWWKARRARAA